MDGCAKMHQLIPDPVLSGGFQVLSQKDHANGDAVHVCGVIPCEGVREPLWKLATWDSGPCLWENRIEGDGHSISDGQYRSFSVNPVDGTLSFLLDTEGYYQGAPARIGDFWPHLLIENGAFGSLDAASDTSRFFECSMDKLVLEMDIRMTEYKATPHAENWVEAAQFLTFFYLKGKNTDDFIWFGAQLFDSRWENSDYFSAIDGGKPDASGRLIYSAGLTDVYRNSNANLWKNGAPMASDEWLHISLDLKPHLEKAFDLAKKGNCVKCDQLSDLVIDGMNIGWESIATFRHCMEIRDLKLTSYR